MTKECRTKGEQARQQLIQAGIILFGQYGLEAATTRDIAKLAQQNIGAIAYYFDSKEGLYQAVINTIIQRMQENFGGLFEEIEQHFQTTSPDANISKKLLLGLFHRYCHILCRPDTVAISRLISREQFSPTAAYDRIHQQILGRFHHNVASLLASASGLSYQDPALCLHAHALIGEVIVFRFGQETIRQRMGWQTITHSEIEQICQVVLEHVELILEGLALRAHPRLHP